MERLFIFIKHNLGFVWRFIEVINGFTFNIIYGSRVKRLLNEVINETDSTIVNCRRLKLTDLDFLYDLIKNQNDDDLKYFQPHGFDKTSLERQLKNPALLMMGTFIDHRLGGYFFLRFFTNKKCFVGRLIDHNYRGRGIGLLMNAIMYEIAWRLGFRCLSTISKKNSSVMKAHATNPNIVILKELANDYLLVEFVRK